MTRNSRMTGMEAHTDAYSARLPCLALSQASKRCVVSWSRPELPIFNRTSPVTAAKIEKGAVKLKDQSIICVLSPDGDRVRLLTISGNGTGILTSKKIRTMMAAPTYSTTCTRSLHITEFNPPMKVKANPNMSSVNDAMTICCGSTSRNMIIETAIAARYSLAPLAKTRPKRYMAPAARRAVTSKRCSRSS